MRYLLLAVLPVAVLLVAACTTADLDDRGDTAVWVDTIPEAEGPKPEGRPVNATCLAPDPPPPAGPIALERAFTHIWPQGTPLHRAIALVEAPTEPGRWYVGLIGGQVLAVSEDANETDVAVVLDIADLLFRGHSEVGLLGMTLHPSEPYLYVTYGMEIGDPNAFVSRLSRFTIGEDGTADRGSELVMIDLHQPHGTHNGNDLAFGPDGMLYYAAGDGRDGDPKHGQDPHTMYAAVSRLDVSQATPDAPYRIPGDNPFADGRAGAPEVWAYGLRNTWRMSFDPLTGDLWGGDVGQATTEEINHIVRGGNYGWPIMEGDQCFRDQSQDCDQRGLISPATSFDHNEGASITCGVVYRGDAIPALSGQLLYADFVTGAIWSYDPVAKATQLQLQSGLNVSSFGQAHDGTAYVVSFSGAGEGGIYKVVANQVPDSDFPRTLSATGCVDPAAPAEPAPGVTRYGVVAPLWSDGAVKERFLALPDDASIGVTDDGDFELPVGAVLMKHFGDGERLHETRLMMHHTTGWAGYSYRWNDAQTDATLLETGRIETLPNGVVWRYPSRGQCVRCHTEAAGDVLGLEVLQQLAAPPAHIDGHTGWPSEAHKLLALDYFSPDINATLDLPRPPGDLLVDPLSDAPLEQRARSYLHANCAQCHRPDGPGQGDLDLRFTTPFADMKLCNVPPDHGWVWLENVEGASLLTPGRPEASVLRARMARVGRHRMPDLGSYVVDEAGLDVIEAWIRSLDPARCPLP